MIIIIIINSNDFDQILNENIHFGNFLYYF